jgi:hypothetical protein
MSDRISGAKSKSKLRSVASWCSPAVRVVKKRNGGGNQNRAIAAAGPGSKSSRSLREEIYLLIEAEAMRMSRTRTAYQELETDGDIGRTFFSSAELILERLERHPQLGSQERQFLMCAIQAVGFALGTESLQVERNNRLRRRAKWVANILSDAMERNELALINSGFFGRDLFDRLSRD